MAKQHLKITVTGRVQGVGYRYHTVKIAEKYGIKGFVQNRYDGAVYIEAEGEAQALQQLVNWCKNGPSRAVVQRVSTDESTNLKDFTSFRVKY